MKFEAHAQRFQVIELKKAPAHYASIFRLNFKFNMMQQITENYHQQLQFTNSKELQCKAAVAILILQSLWLQVQNQW